MSVKLEKGVVSMENYINYNQTLYVVVVNTGKGSDVLKEAKKIGVTGGTIFLGRGTVKNSILHFLGFDEIKKEIILMISKDGIEEEIHEKLTEKFNLEKPNHGILFSTSVKKSLGIHYENNETSKNGGNLNMAYEAIFTIVERGLAEEVVDAANAAGARGATIINARGAGTHEDSTFFSMHIEPEKEVVLILIEKENAEAIIKSINDTMQIDQPGKGILFTMDINRTSGLYNKKK